MHLIEKRRAKSPSVIARFDMNPWVVPQAVQSFFLGQLCCSERQNKAGRGGKKISKAQVLNGSAVEAFSATEGTAQVHSVTCFVPVVKR